MTIYLLLFVIIALAICLAIANTAHSSFTKKYLKYSNYLLNTTFTAGDFALTLVQNSGYKNLKVASTPNELEDAFSSKHNALILSDATIQSYSIAGYATVAHEFGHSVQYNSGQIGYKFFKVFKYLSVFLGRFAFPLIILGIILKFIPDTNNFGSILLIVGLSILLISILTQLFTIPIEYGASKIGLQKIKEYELLDAKEFRMAKRFLKSAGLTYVAAFLSKILAWTFLVPKYK